MRPLHYCIGPEEDGSGTLAHKGEIGDVVVLAFVDLSEDDALYGYPQPSLFTVTGTITPTGGKEVSQYELSDRNGRKVRVDADTANYLYHIQYYLDYVVGEHERQIADSEKAFERMKIQFETLRDVLVRIGKG